MLASFRPVRLLFELLSPGKSFTHRVLRAGFWSALIRSSLSFIGFVRNIVLARLLAPDDFGLFGIALVMLSIIKHFSNTGLKSALVQKKADIHAYLDTAFTIHVVRGTFLALLLWLVAPQAALFFEEPRAAPFIQVLAVIIFLRGFHNLGLVHYARELEVQRQNVHQVVSDIADLVVSIVAAIVLRNAWALMLGLLAGQVVAVVVSYAIHPYRPRLHFRLDYARELGRFGRWVFLNNILFFLANRADNLVVGKFLGAPALGIYMLAFSISGAATTELSRMLTSVAFPAYSRIQDELERLQRAYNTAIELVASMTLPAAVALSLLAEPLTLALLGDQWLEVAYLLPPLAFAAAIRTIVSNGTTVYQALGRPERSFLVNLIGIIATYAALFPLMYRYGLVGVGMAVLIGKLAVVPLYLVHTRTLLKVDWRMLLRALLPAGVLSLAVALPLVTMLLLTPQIRVVELIIAAMAASLFYLAVAYLLWQSRQQGPLRILSMIGDKRRKSRAVGDKVLSGTA